MTHPDPDLVPAKTERQPKPDYPRCKTCIHYSETTDETWECIDDNELNEMGGRITHREFGCVFHEIGVSPPLEGSTMQQEEKKDHSGTSLTADAAVSVLVPTPELQHDATELREGDVYLFQYSEAERKRANGHDLNWCFDGQVVVRNGKLCDTYWGFDNNEARVVRPDQGTLRFVCNLADVRRISEYETRWYEPEDVFNLSYNHGCHKRFMVKTGANESAQRMLQEVREKEADVNRDIQHGIRTLADLAVMRSKLESGDISRKPWW